jgi:hypothetical protein
VETSVIVAAPASLPLLGDPNAPAIDDREDGPPVTPSEGFETTTTVSDGGGGTAAGLGIDAG